MSSKYLDRWAGLSQPIHGGTSLSPGVIDFSISVNPCPLPQSAADAYISAWELIGKYPDTANGKLIEAASSCFDIPENQLLMTNGSAEAFSMIASVFLGPGKTAMVINPCYSDYEHVSKLTGAAVEVISLSPESGFTLEPQNLISEIKIKEPSILWLCSPNNPTGVVFDKYLIEKASAAMEKHGGVVVLDEAYTAFAENSYYSSGDLTADNIINVRSLTKDFGIPGLRLGYLRSSYDILRVLNLHKPCWSVNMPAQITGSALLGEIEYFKSSWRKIAELRLDIIEDMQALGVNPYDAAENGCAAFIFFKNPELSGGKGFLSLMFDQGVRIRNCTSMGAPGYSRIGVRMHEENQIFLRGLKSVLKGDKND